MLEEYKRDARSPYPSVRTVSERLAELGYKTYRDTLPSRETIRKAMHNSEEGTLLMQEAVEHFKMGGFS